MKSLRVHRSAGILAVCGLLLIAVLAGCGGGGATPSPAALKSIAISPSSANIPRGGTQPFTATGTFSDNSTKDITATCVWMSSNTAVVTISSSGLATAVSSAGIGQTANITCSQSGVSAATASMVTVAAAALTSITVTGASSVNVGATTPAFTATGHFGDGTTLPLTNSTTPAVGWSSSSTVNATVDVNTGAATGVHSGTANIISTSGSIMGSAPLTVVAVLSSIAVSPSAVNIPPGGSRNFTASATFNDGTMQAITNSCLWASSNTAEVTIVASTGVATAPASATVGLTSDITCSAAIPAGTTTVISSPPAVATISAPGPLNELNGQYAFVLRGFGGSNPVGHELAMAGSFTADGNGNVTGGVMDVTDTSSGTSANLPIIAAPASSYSVGTDNRGKLTLNTAAGTRTFDFAVGGISSGVASLGHIIDTTKTTGSAGSAISGVFKRQDASIVGPTFSLAALDGDFAFLEEGRNAAIMGNPRFAAAGRFTLTAGTLNGIFDENAAGVVTNGTFSAPLVLTDATNGRLQLSNSSISPDAAVYIVSANEALFVTIGNPTGAKLLTGSILRQSTTFCPTAGACNFATNSPSPLNGTAVVYFQGNSNSCPPATPGGSLVQVGDETFAPGATAGTGTLSFGFDTNDCGSILPPSGNSDSGTYSVAADGRVAVTLTSGHPAPILYMVNTNQAFLVGSDSRVTAGAGEPQQVGTIAFTSHNDSFGTEAPAVSGSGVFSGVLTFTANSSTMGTITSQTQDVNSIASGLRENVSVAGDTTTLDPTTSRFTFGSGTKVGYFINPTRRVVIDIQTTDTAPTLNISDNQ